MALASIVFFLAASNRSPVREFIATLGVRDIAAVYEAIQALAAEFPMVATVTIKHLDGKLWELKIGRFRVLYGVATDTLLVVHVFAKKSQKTPKNDLELALERLASMLRER